MRDGPWARVRRDVSISRNRDVGSSCRPRPTAVPDRGSEVRNRQSRGERPIRDSGSVSPNLERPIRDSGSVSPNPNRPPRGGLLGAELVLTCRLPEDSWDPIRSRGAQYYLREVRLVTVDSVWRRSVLRTIRCHMQSRILSAMQGVTMEIVGIVSKGKPSVGHVAEMPRKFQCISARIVRTLSVRTTFILVVMALSDVRAATRREHADAGPPPPPPPVSGSEHHRRGQRGPAELRHRNHRQRIDHQQHGQRRELHHGGRRVHGDIDGLRRSNRGELRSHRGGHGRHADDHRGGVRGPAGLREPGLHRHGHERRSVDGQRGVRRRDELGHGLRAAALRVQHAHRDQHLRLLGRSLPDEELGGLEQAASVQQQRGPRQRPGAAAAGQPEREGLPGARRRGAPVRADHDQRRGAGADEIAGNTGNVVCNTSFTNLSDSRVKTEMAEADVAELQQLFDSVEAKQYKRPDMNEDLRLGFASNDFAGTKWKNLTGTVRWSDGTEMVTLDYSLLWGVCKGFQCGSYRGDTLVERLDFMAQLLLS